jgi:hypothetical protein
MVQMPCSKSILGVLHVCGESNRMSRSPRGHDRSLVAATNADIVQAMMTVVYFIVSRAYS